MPLGPRATTLRLKLKNIGCVFSSRDSLHRGRVAAVHPNNRVPEKRRRFIADIGMSTMNRRRLLTRFTPNSTQRFYHFTLRDGESSSSLFRSFSPFFSRLSDCHIIWKAM